MKKNAAPLAAFDYEGPARGLWATLLSGTHRVTLTEHPRTLLSMYWAGVLVGQAFVDAKELAETEEGRAYLAWRERMVGVTVP